MKKLFYFSIVFLFVLASLDIVLSLWGRSQLYRALLQQHFVWLGCGDGHRLRDEINAAGVAVGGKKRPFKVESG